MHKIYVTEGLVIGKRGVGEANTLVALLTQELGLVRVAARSARREASKLRYGLEPLTSARFSFIRGRHEWKLTGVEAVSRELLASSATRRAQVGKVLRLVLRLVHGEEPVPELYDTLLRGLRHLSVIADDADAQSVEYVLVLRMLAHLGYVSERPELAPYLSGDYLSPEMLVRVRASRQMLIRTINDSLSMTGL